MTGYGNWHHPVSTNSAQAQAFFDQGLRLIYAFNHDEAARSFQRSAELDPQLAMAYWGIAESVGPNYNDPASEGRFVQAHAAHREKRRRIAAEASESDKAYIAALAKRFPGDPKSDLRAALEQYRDAMRDVVKRFPDDLDAATLFAEAGMNLHPWGLWRPDGTPQEGTEEIVATLESVIRREPNHLGGGFTITFIPSRLLPRQNALWPAQLAWQNLLPPRDTSCTCRAYLHPHRRLRSRGENQPESRARRPSLLQGQRSPRHLFDDVLQPQSAFHRHGRGYEWQLSRVPARRADARGQRESSRERDAAARRLPDRAAGRRSALSQVERNSENSAARPGHADRHGVLAFRSRSGPCRHGKTLDEAEAEHKIVAEAEEKTPRDAIFQMPINKQDQGHPENRGKCCWRKNLAREKTIWTPP